MEMVDLYDENRLPLGRTAERYAPKGEGEYRVVVHICVFDSRGRLLIQQRSREKAVWPEAWDVSAAGGVDAGETSRQAAEREFREELGVALDLTGVRPSCTVNFDGGFDDFFLVERDLGLEELTLQKEEVARARWAELPEILDMVDRGGVHRLSQKLSGVFVRHAGDLRLLHQMKLRLDRSFSAFSENGLDRGR